jgi:hypothetical protein
MTNELTLPAVSRLRRALGPSAADRCAEAALGRLGLYQLESATVLLESTVRHLG